MIRRVISLLKFIYFKLKYQNSIKVNALHSNIRFDTEINIGRTGYLYLDKIFVQTNVHLVCMNGVLNIGDQVNFNRNCIVVCREKISIGSNCSFGPNVCIYDHDHAFDKNGLVKGKFKCSEVVIEDNCWIGAGVIILRGTHIGKNSIIGAGTIVKGKVEDYSLVTSDRGNTLVPLCER